MNDDDTSTNDDWAGSTRSLIFGLAMTGCFMVGILLGTMVLGRLPAAGIAQEQQAEEDWDRVAGYQALRAGSIVVVPETFSTGLHVQGEVVVVRPASGVDPLGWVPSGEDWAMLEIDGETRWVRLRSITLILPQSREPARPLRPRPRPGRGPGDTGETGDSDDAQ